jgi:adenylate kinase family enzyme
VVRKLAVISAPGAFHVLGAAELAGDAMELEVFSVGGRVRERVQQRTAWGRRISEYLEGGRLVPEEMLTELVVDLLSDVVGGWLLFGHWFPLLPSLDAGLRAEPLSEQDTVRRFAAYLPGPGSRARR